MNSNKNKLYVNKVKASAPACRSLAKAWAQADKNYDVIMSSYKKLITSRIKKYEPLRFACRNFNVGRARADKTYIIQKKSFDYKKNKNPEIRKKE